MICKSCYSIGKIFELSYEKIRNNLWLAKCTNPNHYTAFYVSYQFIDGGYFLRRQKMAKPKNESYSTGDMVHYWDGTQERKISRAHLADIRSRAVTEDGTVLRGKKGIKYNVERGGKMYQSDKVMG